MNFSDVHLGNSRTSSEFIINNVQTMLSPPVLLDLDMIIIAGDLFDKELPLAGTWQIQQFILFLIRAAYKYDIVIRILEGTPSHDRGQGAIINTLIEAYDKKVDVKYYDDVAVEHIDSLDLDILYVPDEWSSDHDATWYAVNEALRKAGLTSVHMSIMHGMFEHQLPNGIPRPCHSLERYSSITEYYIVIGHIHKFSINGKAVSCGSTDRLAFNEESPKGMVQLLIDRLMYSNSEIRFIENVGAKQYKTFDLTKIEPEDIELALDEVSHMPADSYVAVLTQRTPVKLGVIDSVKLRNPNLNWRARIIKDDVSTAEPVLIDEVINITPINQRTVTNLIRDRLSMLSTDKIDISRMLELLEEIK